MRQQNRPQERMTVQQYRAQLQGKVNRAQGAAFEDVINASCIYYDLQGEAFIEKTPEPMKPIRAINRQRGTFEAVYEKQAQPDYKGTMKGGQAVCFEAKHTDTDRIKQSAVSSQQEEALDKHQAMGAYCFVLVSLGHRFYRVPWSHWKVMKIFCGHKYMNQKDLEPYEVFYIAGVIRFLDLSKDARRAINERLGLNGIAYQPGTTMRVESAGAVKKEEERNVP